MKQIASFALFFLVAVLQLKAQDTVPPAVNHILLEVRDMKASIIFYHDILGLRIKMQKDDFTILEAGNMGIFLSTGHWDWDQPRPKETRPGWGMYPHFAVTDAMQTIEKAKQAGYKIPQEPKEYDWGTEAFVTDPDGYVLAITSK